MTSEEWPDEQREALERWASKDPEDRHPHDLIPGEGGDTRDGYSNEVPPDECIQMRQLFKDADDTTIRDLVQSDRFSYSRETIARHVFGRDECNHDITESPAQDGLEQPSSEERVSDQECEDMRESFMEGSTVVDVRKEFDRTYDQTYYHIVGRCKCDNGIDPADSGAKE